MEKALKLVKLMEQTANEWRKRHVASLEEVKQNPDTCNDFQELNELVYEAQIADCNFILKFTAALKKELEKEVTK